MTPADLGDVEVHELENGLAVAIVRSEQAPIVSTVVWYRVGTADEDPHQGGIAHFLEHMMFKGSRSYGPGEVDKVTQALGGSNNAFTGHDLTAYYFQFAADCWTKALEIESDRMVDLRLDPEEVDRERQVVLEEIAMYESDPWDALERRVQERVFGDHPYARPVLGTTSSLTTLSADDLRKFHDRYYRPERAVVAIAGAVGPDALDNVKRCFAGIPAGSSGIRPRQVRGPLCGDRRLSRRHGDVPRLLWAVPSPARADPLHPPLRLLSQALTEGKSSRLHRGLVEEGQLCSWVAGELSASLEPGTLSIAVELVPGAEPAEVEARLFELVAEVIDQGLSGDELQRARRTYEADWVFGHERIHQRALTVASALGQGDLDFPCRHFEATVGASAADVQGVAEIFLDPTSGVIGWSLPEEAGA